ncbi:hypothetical protein L6164_020497 [Bauhinia variegata]|nr:hypothetical protein L6164_020497 [Bauhinia variegata]
MDLFLVGTSTGAATVIWAMAELVKNPRTMNKAQADGRNWCGKKGFVEEDDIHKLSYLNAVIKNKFRTHPVGPLLYQEKQLKLLLQRVTRFKTRHWCYRICLGLSISVANVEIILANLLYKFDWEMPTGMKNEDIDTEMSPGLTQHKKNPLYLVAKNYE